MNRIIATILSLSSYFDEYWWSFIQDSQSYFCDRDGNILIDESAFYKNPVKHFFMCCKYDLKYWDECNLEGSIFDNKTYNLPEVNKRMIKYGLKPDKYTQVFLDDEWVQHVDYSVKEKCCFCNKSFSGQGNSTWPIYYREDGETHRCCDKCNTKYVLASRIDRTLIMKFRKKFGIDYTEYEKKEN